MSRAAGLLLGHLADRALGDPGRFHPVAGFGRVAGALERRTYADARTRGAAYTLVLVGGTTAAGVVLERRTRGRAVMHTAVTAAATWAVLGGRSLDREAATVGRLLDSDLVAARRRLTHLVGRDTRTLDPGEVARAVVESLAENTSDAVVAPLVLGSVAGVPGLLGHRAANTLDAMVGHRSRRYRQFGWASARLDDLLNLPGSRLTAGLAVVLGEDRASAVRAWRRDARGHPSPNAGPVEAAFAGALGVRLGGSNVYGDAEDRHVEHRAVLGDGRPVVPADIEAARTLAARVHVGAVVVSVLVALVRERRSRRRRPPAR
ncbi:MAG TPA: cobalamin biosynthesis protein [Marmoricola sp.]|nr:cobalamin biosynthesis protein [Marmoricola sp.]